jgi:hypothetical protein
MKKTLKLPRRRRKRPGKLLDLEHLQSEIFAFPQGIPKDADGWYLVWKCGEKETVHYAEKAISRDAKGNIAGFTKHCLPFSPLRECQYKIEVDAYKALGLTFIDEPLPGYDCHSLEGIAPGFLEELSDLVGRFAGEIACIKEQRRGRPRDPMIKSRDARIVKLHDVDALSWEQIKQRMQSEGFFMTTQAVIKAYQRHKKHA